MQSQTSISDQFASVSPLIIVLIVLGLTLLRVATARSPAGWARTIADVCDTATFVLIFAFLLIRPFVAQAFYIPSESMVGTLLVKDRLLVDKFSYRLHSPRFDDVVVFEAPPAAEPTPGIDYIKRVIGLPGDLIQVRPAAMTIAGVPVDPEGFADIHGYLREKLNLAPDASLKIFPDHLLVDGTHVVTMNEVAADFDTTPANIHLEPGETLRNGRVLDEPYTREDPDYTFPAEGGSFQVGPGQLFMMGDNRNRSKDSHYWGALDQKNVVGRADLIFWPVKRAGLIR